jgi:hypothetical protein
MIEDQPIGADPSGSIAVRRCARVQEKYYSEQVCLVHHFSDN